MKRVDDNDLERNLKLEKVVDSEQLRLVVETNEERRARMENVAATKRLRLAMEMDEERKSRLEKMVATAQIMLALTKGVVNVCLSFKLDVHRRKEDEFQKFTMRAVSRNVIQKIMNLNNVELYEAAQ